MSCEHWGPDARVVWYFGETRRARKQEVCGECRRPIEIGKEYAWHSGYSEDRVLNLRVCLRCESAREALEAEGPLVPFGDLVASLRERNLKRRLERRLTWAAEACVE